MINLSPELELAIRAALKAKIETVPAIGAVFPREVFVTSKIDFFDKVGMAVADDLELRMCEVTLLKFQDSLLEGCDDMPVVYLSYNVKIQHEYNDSRGDGSNSFDDFVRAGLDLRNAFLINRRMNFTINGVVTHTEHAPLVQTDFIITDDAVLHTANFQVKVTIY